MFFEHKHRWIAPLLAGLVLGGVSAPVLGAKPDEPVRLSRIVGKVRAPDGKVGVRDSRVHAYHLSTGRLYTSEPTGSGGAFEIAGLPFGYFELAVETGEGLFVAGSMVNLAPASKAVVLLLLAPYDAQPESWWSSHERRSFSGSEEETRGIAEIRRKLSGREFLRSTKGVVLLSTVGAAVLLVIAASDDPDERLASPFR